MKTILVKTMFEALHQYKDAPKNVEFLKHPHRHQFHVEVEITVEHGDRELEFFTVKHILDDYVLDAALFIQSYKNVIALSCEDMAERIADELATRLKIDRFRIRYVEVSEDGQNAGRYYTT
jgi:6-pyruvoyl-tetrahydropterin synthase